jgi:bifunctional non-homologous end joining protein LigD
MISLKSTTGRISIGPSPCLKPGCRILVDTGRNDYSATFAAAYTVRARPGAPVSAPCTWEEVERGEVVPRSFTIRNMAERIENVGDLWSGLLKTKRSLRLPSERLDKIMF